jgi:DNA replication licensing factor MCM3
MAAEEIMRFALYKEVLKRQRKKKRKLNGGGASGARGDDEGSEEETDGEEDEDEIEVPQRMSVPPAKSKDVPQPSQDPIWGDDSQDVQMDLDQPAAAGPADNGGVRPERYVFLGSNRHLLIFLNIRTLVRLQLFRTKLAHLFATKLQDDESTFLTDLLPMINEGMPVDTLFGTAEATAVCLVMQEANDLMISDGIVYKI